MSLKKDEFNFANNDTIYNKYLEDLKNIIQLKINTQLKKHLKTNY